MVNIRLLNFFDQERTFSTLQCDCRARRANIDHLLSLEVTVSKVQTNIKQVASICFHREKANGLTWRHGILMDINEAGTEGRMLNFQENFLKPRSFKI